MNTTLEEIQEYVQQVGNVISSVLDLEVTIIDNDLKLIAATGFRAMEIGSYYEEAHLTDGLLASGGFHVVEDTQNYQVCLKCSRREKGKCNYLSAVVSSIKIEDEVIGTIGVIAATPEQKARLLSNVEGINEFTKKISDLLGVAIKEKESNKRLSLLTDKYQMVVNSVYEGIISVDCKGYITHYNHQTQMLLDISSKDSILGVHINEFFPDLDLQEAFRHKAGLACNFQFNKGRKQKEDFAGIITVIQHEGHVEGLTLSFRTVQEMQRFASSLLDYEANFTFDDIIGESNIIEKIKKTFQKSAITDSTILIQGESGTGKDLFARAIHAYSLRSNGPFVSINCGAIPETLLESELFGYEEGAFTGARRGGKPGKFELAHRGTIFLDEIGDIPLHLQVKLLKVLEEKKIERVGGTRAIPIDVRIIAATHRELEKMMENQRFREDLYYRLSVIPVFIPPLRERKEDIRPLMNKFFTDYNKKMGKRVSGFSQQALDKILEYHWPGNIRELENAVEYAINMVNDGYIQTEHLPARIIKEKWKEVNHTRKSGDNIKDMEQKAIIEALNKFGTSGSGKEKAAQYLGISRATIYRKLQELKNEGKSFDL